MCSSLPQACRPAGLSVKSCAELRHLVGSTSLELLARNAAAVLGIRTIRILLALSAHRNPVTWSTWCLELGSMRAQSERKSVPSL